MQTETPRPHPAAAAAAAAELLGIRFDDLHSPVLSPSPALSTYEYIDISISNSKDVETRNVNTPKEMKKNCCTPHADTPIDSGAL